jgi:hypothetical protein
MGERAQSELAFSFAEVMHLVIEEEYRRGQRDVDEMMRRLKDLSAYSLAHAEILTQREGVELLALSMFFGMTSNPEIRRRNEGRLQQISEETAAYQGRSELVEAQIAARKVLRGRQKKGETPQARQRRLL